MSVKQYGSIMELHDDYMLSIKFELSHYGWGECYPQLFDTMEKDGWVLKERDFDDAWKSHGVRFRVYRQHPCSPPIFYDYSVVVDKQEISGVCLGHESGLEFFFLGVAYGIAVAVGGHYSIEAINCLIKRLKDFTFKRASHEEKVGTVEFRTKNLGNLSISIIDVGEEDVQSIVLSVKQGNSEGLPKGLRAKMRFSFETDNIGEAPPPEEL